MQYTILTSNHDRIEVHHPDDIVDYLRSGVSPLEFETADGQVARFMNVERVERTDPADGSVCWHVPVPADLDLHGVRFASIQDSLGGSALATVSRDGKLVVTWTRPGLSVIAQPGSVVSLAQGTIAFHHGQDGPTDTYLAADGSLLVGEAPGQVDLISDSVTADRADLVGNVVPEAELVRSLFGQSVILVWTGTARAVHLNPTDAIRRTKDLCQVLDQHGETSLTFDALTGMEA